MHGKEEEVIYLNEGVSCTDQGQVVDMSKNTKLPTEWN